MMMNKVLSMRQLRRVNMGFTIAPLFGKRTMLSQAYYCEEEWAKRLESPLLQSIKIDQYFIDTDKKFDSKNLVSGVDIDLFANYIQSADNLDELEHLLYRFRKTKRSVEMMDSTVYAVIQIFLKCKQYESLFRILEDPDNYGIFPDSCSYNILMDTFLKEDMPKEASKIAICMMLQEDFSNEISCVLALKSCQMFLNKYELDPIISETLPEEKGKEEDEEEEEEDEEEEKVRVPFLRNPFFDDHFHLTHDQHLIGKTFFLVGRALKNDLIGRTYHLLGLGMYEKWDAALELLNSLVPDESSPVLLSQGVEEFKQYMNGIRDEDVKKKFEDMLSKLQQNNKIKSGDLVEHLNLKMKSLSAYEEQDIQIQKKWFEEWEQKRALLFEKQNLEFELEKRLQKIAEKKEYLYWKEKQLFFFENEQKILTEFEKAEEITSKLKTKEADVDSYIPPEIIKKPAPKMTRYQKLARVKKL